MTTDTPKRGALTREAMQAITQARLTHGVRGRAAPTETALRFALDHALAREAVTSELDVPHVQTQLRAAGLETRTVASAAETRDTFIRRPDLGRLLPDAQAKTLSTEGPVDVALVLGDGLSAIAVALSGAAFMSALTARLAARGLTCSPVVLARQARVALGDGVAQALGAQTVVMALGERPGLSAADSLGVYITHAPQPATPDSARNCLSNIRDAGLPVDAAAAQAERLILAMRQTGLSGVALSQSLSSGQLPG